MTLSRATALAVTSAVVLTTTALAPRPAMAANAPATAAAQFLANEFTRLGDVYPSATSPGNNDAGLAADALLALHRAGVAPDVQAAATAKLRANFFSAKIVAAGTLGKDLIVAGDQGVDPHHWGNDSDGGNIDLVDRLQHAQDKAGSYLDTPFTGPSAPSNVFSQALAVIGLHRTGRPVAAGVGMLLRQQCPAGGFRLDVPAGGEDGTCAGDDDSSADTTAMGVWALTEAGGHANEVARAVHWLRGQEDPATGAFGADPKAPAQVNANSSGLAAMALAMGGDGAAASRVNGWLASMQVPADVAVPAMAGAVVRGDADRSAIAADPHAFWSKSSGADNLGKQDALRRATAQAVLGLAAAVPGPRPPGQSNWTGGGPGSGPGGSGPGGAGPGVPGQGGVVGQGGQPGQVGQSGQAGQSGRAGQPGAGAPGVPVPGGGATSPQAGFGGPPGFAPGGPGFGTPRQAGAARALPGSGGFAAFLSSPAGIALTVLAALVLAGGTFWMLVRRKGSWA